MKKKLLCVNPMEVTEYCTCGWELRIAAKTWHTQRFYNCPDCGKSTKVRMG